MTCSFEAKIKEELIEKEEPYNKELKVRKKSEICLRRANMRLMSSRGNLNELN
jgi:hypothetical protein